MPPNTIRRRATKPGGCSSASADDSDAAGGAACAAAGQCVRRVCALHAAKLVLIEQRAFGSCVGSGGGCCGCLGAAASDAPPPPASAPLLGTAPDEAEAQGMQLRARLRVQQRAPGVGSPTVAAASPAACGAVIAPMARTCCAAGWPAASRWRLGCCEAALRAAGPLAVHERAGWAAAGASARERRQQQPSRRLHASIVRAPAGCGPPSFCRQARAS